MKVHVVLVIFYLVKLLRISGCLKKKFPAVFDSFRVIPREHIWDHAGTAGNFRELFNNYGDWNGDNLLFSQFTKIAF